MSADDFQSKYASVMESMLKSAIAETTKLFENMVDELKAEISQIKKENEDLKTRCFQYETAKSKPDALPGESLSITEPGDASEKCDTAVQCDLVPCRTILVEECEPLVHTQLERQAQQYSYEWNNYSLQEHNYVSYRDRTSQMEFVVVKKEESHCDSSLQSQLKQENDDPDVACGQVLGSFGASVGGADIGGPNINNSSAEHVTVPRKSKNQVVLQLPCSETNNSQIAQNQSTDIQHSLVISLKDALRDDIKEEAEIVEVAERELSTSGDKQMVPQACRMDSATTHNEQSPLQSASVSTQMASVELNSKVSGGEANSKPNSSSGRRRGRPPKKTKQKEAIPSLTDKGPNHQVDLTSYPLMGSLTHPSPPLVTVTSSVSNLSVKESSNISFEGTNTEVESLSSSFSGEQPIVKLQERCPEVGNDSTADKTPNISIDVTPRASSSLLKGCQTSVSLQDALLLVEAMNQSTMENGVSPLKVPSQPQIESSSASSVGCFKTVAETPTAQQSTETRLTSAQNSPVSANLTAEDASKEVDHQNVVMPQSSNLPAPLSCTASLSSLSSTVVTQTVIQSLPLPLINIPPPSKGPRTIIILPRPSLASDNAKAGSQTLHSSVNSATMNKCNLPPSSTAEALPHERPALSSVPQKTIKVVYRKQDHVIPLQSNTILKDRQDVAPQTITIVSKPIPSVVSREHEPISPSVKEDKSKLRDSVPPESSKQLISELQESSLSCSNHAILSEKINDTNDDLNSSGQIPSIVECILAPRQEHSGPEQPADQVQSSVSSSLPQATECKLSAVVRLTRLPFFISTKEPVLMSTLISKGIVQGKPSSSHVSEEEPVDNYLHSPGPSTPDRQTPDLEQDILCRDMEDEQEDAIITEKDTSHPHIQMSKTQFLAKLSVSPLENKSNANESSNAKGTKSIVSRLRCHLQAHLEAKRSSTKKVAETEMKTDNKNKKPRLNVEDIIEEPDRTLSIVSPKKISCTQRSGPHKVSGEPDNISTMSGSTNESSNAGYKKPSSGRHCLGSKNMKSSSECSRQSSSPKENTTMKITKSTSVSPRTSSSDENNTISRAISVSHERPTSISSKITSDVSTPKSTKSSSLTPKRLPKVAFSLEKTKSSAVENSSSHGMSGTPSCSTPHKFKPRTKPMKRESSSFSPRRYIVDADGSITETTKREPKSPSLKHRKMAKRVANPQMSGESNPKKPRPLQGHPGRKINHKVVNARKLTNEAKGKRRVGKKRGSYKKKKLELPVIQSGVLKKCQAKVWYPPTLPPNEKPITDIIRPPPLKVEYRVPNIPFSAPPIVSPLQPLAVIGRHLLRNQCGECGRVFSNTNALESHVGLHKIYRPFSCKLCGKYFPDAKTFKRHDRVHRNGRIHVCQHCGKGFVYRFGLSKHIQMVHGRIRPFICQVCGKGFYTKRDVEIHIRIHTGEKPFQCDICQRRFTRKVELNVHLRWHNGEKRHWCQYCGKGFLDYNNLKRHRYTHTGEKPYSCPHCPKNFTQTGHLKKHVKSVHQK
ncbi:uncharacterized protein LOC124869068 isoform X2 [Girardinichthys multiradiatus]|uniref:uncharacterized protein LOC124869068 isoform X2 n=1 Tax=Girardinichthys multiradiatus TaxID=208333 RepID=UPI001FAC7B50|nr:uncharacterized protein LOC124869068 isoform X2 [Girardinichthys multiradiatus]